MSECGLEATLPDAGGEGNLLSERQVCSELQLATHTKWTVVPAIQFAQQESADPRVVSSGQQQHVGIMRWYYGRVTFVHPGGELVDVRFDSGEKVVRVPAAYELMAVPNAQLERMGCVHKDLWWRRDPAHTLHSSSCGVRRLAVPK